MKTWNVKHDSNSMFNVPIYPNMVQTLYLVTNKQSYDTSLCLLRMTSYLKYLETMYFLFCLVLNLRKTGSQAEKERRLPQFYEQSS